MNDCQTSITEASPLLPLVIGISARAMFDLTEEHEVFEKAGLEAYAKLQRERERVPLKAGAAFEVTRRLLALNPPDSTPVAEVIFLSRNSPNLSLRAFHSFGHHGLPIQHASFTSGRSVAPFVRAWNVDLFLSNDDQDVKDAVAAGTAAARLGPAPSPDDNDPVDEIRFALDGDAVIFSEKSDDIYTKHGLSHFHEHERANTAVPMGRGPFGKTFLPKLALLRQKFTKPDGTTRVRISIVTARNARAHERVIQALRAWGTPADEAHFAGRYAKGPILRATRAHIFFGNQEKHILRASEIAAGHVPGPHQPGNAIIPA